MSTYHRIPLLLHLTLLVFFGCGRPSDPQIVSYLNQSPPDSTALIFAPDFISTGLNERDAAFTQDGKSFYFSVWTGTTGSICVSRFRKGRWTKPEVAPFSGIHSDIEPFISPDGNQFFFVSRRPLNGIENKDYDIWVMDRNGDGWGEPRNIGRPVNSERDEFYPSVTSDGTLYFTGSYQESVSGEDIYRADWDGTGYSDPERLDDQVNSNSYDFNALIAPDESWILFSSWGRPDDHGGGDLYISFRGPGGTWTQARNAGTVVNSSALDYCPALSPDGQYLFFSSRRTLPDFMPDSPLTYKKLNRMLNMPGNGSGDIFWIRSDRILQNP